MATSDEYCSFKLNLWNKEKEYGVTSTGFNRMRLDEIHEDIRKNLSEKLGVEVSTEPNSAIGMLIGIYASELDRVWQLLEKDYYDRSPISACESSLDNTLAYTGVVRTPPTSSFMFATCYGEDGTVLPSRCQIRGNDINWNIERASTISLNNAVNVKLGTPKLDEGTTYGLRIQTNSENDIDIYYTVSKGDTIAHIQEGLISQIEKIEEGYRKSNKEFEWSLKVGKEKDKDSLILSKKSRRYGSIVIPSGGFEVKEVGSPIRFISEETGAYSPAENTVTGIVTLVNGWKSVSNESSAYLGNDAETPSDVRKRYAKSVYRNSVAMKESLTAALMDLEDVSTVLVYENKTDEPVVKNGKTIMKPHSFRVVISGGDNYEIAQTILNKAPLGIDTNGENEYRVQDSSGLYDTVRFDRPKKIYIYMHVYIEQYDEETIPGNIVDLVKNIILEKAKNFEVGVDVIPQRFFGDIYKEVTGIEYIKIELYASEEKVPIDDIDFSEYSTSKIPIPEDSLAEFFNENIYVEVKPLGS